MRMRGAPAASPRSPAERNARSAAQRAIPGCDMLDGVMLLWFVLTALAVLFVAVDIRNTPEHPVLKWGFILLTAYTGVIGAFLYVLGCREPLPGLHEQYVSTQWRQTLGSTMHCVAGDGVGILAGAVLSSLFGLRGLTEIALEYVLGFAFGWSVFQALFMRDMFGGSYMRSLRGTFVPELLSMNMLMAGMVVTATGLRVLLGTGSDPATPAFWFVMSMALLVGFITAYPMNWWLVRHGLKHGMMTVRASGTGDAHAGHEMHAKPAGNPHAAHGGGTQAPPPEPSLTIMTLRSFIALGTGLVIASTLSPR